MGVPYPFISAAKSLWKDRWINLLSILTVATSLLIVTLAFISLYNFDLLAKQVSAKFSMVVYLKDTVSTQERQAVVAALKQRREIATFKYISKDEALKELKTALKDTAAIIEGLGENPLLPSIEVTLRQEFVAAQTARELAEIIGKMQGVDAVSYGEKAAETISLLKRSVEGAGIILLVLISTGIVFVIYSAVKILFYRRTDEIEILKLLGATSGFIRGPFVIEGGIIGTLAGVLGALGSFLFHLLVTERLSAAAPVLKAVVFPQEVILALPVIGLLLGIIGALIALGRLRL